MSLGYKFNRLELAGALGDVGTLLPLAIGMVMINGLSSSGLFLSIGVFYILSGIYYGITSPVQPMKVIGAYSIAMALSASQIVASGFLVAVLLLIIGGTGAITLIGKYVPKSVIRGVQMSTGALLMAQGVKFIIGTSKYQILQKAAEPYLQIQHIGPIPLGVIIGAVACAATLYFLNSKRFPAALIVLTGGLLCGALLGTHAGFSDLSIGFHLPDIMPFGFPSGADFSFALVILVLPQLPMTLGNAVIANADLSQQYFAEDSKKVTYKALCFSMSMANFFSFFVGGMPLCHGAGGLAAHYRFGARTAGSNLMIGVIFLCMALFLGRHTVAVVNLIPFSVLGALLIFAGGQLALTIIDIRTRNDLFVCFVMMAATLASNLAVGFGVGILLAYALKSEKINI